MQWNYLYNDRWSFFLPPWTHHPKNPMSRHWTLNEFVHHLHCLVVPGTSCDSSRGFHRSTSRRWCYHQGSRPPTHKHLVSIVAENHWSQHQEQQPSLQCCREHLVDNISWRHPMTSRLGNTCNIHQLEHRRSSHSHKLEEIWTIWFYRADLIEIYFWCFMIFHMVHVVEFHHMDHVNIVSYKYCEKTNN